MSVSIFEVATKIGTPIALAALIILVLYKLYKALLPKAKSKEKETIATYLFVLALVATVLGMTYYLVIELEKLNKPPTESSLENRVISINIKEMPLEEALQLIARKIGAVAAILRTGSGADARLKEPITLNTNSEVEVVMNEICRLKCEWEIQPGGGKPALFVRFE